MRSIHQIIVHHSASPMSWRTEDIRIAHLDRGFYEIGYHKVVVTELLVVEDGRSIEKIGAHDLGENVGSIGVCIIGDFTVVDIHDYPEALQLLVQCVAELVTEYGLTPNDVYGHCENEPPETPTLCPGFDPAIVRDGVREYLQQKERDMPKLSLKEVLKVMPLADIIETVATLLHDGFDADEIKDSLPTILDQLVSFDVLFPGPIGETLEMLDGHAFGAIVTALWPLIHKRAKRKAANKTVRAVRDVDGP